MWVVEDLLYGDRLEADILALRCVIAGELLQAATTNGRTYREQDQGKGSQSPVPTSSPKSASARIGWYQSHPPKMIPYGLIRLHRRCTEVRFM